jgi:hypothetical protein
MLSRLRRLIRGTVPGPCVETDLKPEGEEGIRQGGHREYVGGFWDEIGKLQFDFMVQQGLKPSDCFLDIACGALRGGVHFSPYSGCRRSREVLRTETTSAGSALWSRRSRSV